MSQDDRRSRGIALENAARKEVEKENLTQALQLYAQVLEVAESLEDLNWQASALANLGETAHAMGKLAPSLEFWQRAQKVAQKIPSPGRETSALVGQGRVYGVQGQPEKAHRAFQEAIQLSSKIERKEERADFLVSCGYALGELGKPEDALEAVGQAERLYRELQNSLGLATALDIRSHICRKNDQLQKALDAAISSLTLYQTLKDHLKVMIAQNKIALMYQDQAEPQKALFYLNQTLRLGEETHDTRILGETLTFISGVYQSLGEPQKALSYNQQAIEARRRDKTPQALAWALGLQANLLAEQKQPQKALVCLQEALQLCQTVKNQKFEAELMSSIGLIYERLSEPAQARSWYEKALTLQRETGAFEAEAYTLQSLGSLSFSQPKVARTYLEQARKCYRAHADRLGEVGALTLLGNLEYTHGQQRAAEELYQQALTLVEQLRRDAGAGMSAQRAFFEQLSAPYGSYLTLLVEQGRAQEAFVLTQQIKARSLQDLMAGGRIDLSGQLTEQERKEEQRQRARCDALAAAMVQEAARNVVGSKKRFEARKAELAVAERELAIFQDRLYAKHPGLQHQRMAKLASLDQLAKALPTGAALLEFAPLDGNRTVLFVLTQARTGRPTVTAHKVLPAQEKTIRALREACTNPQKPWQDSAKKLYRALIAPVEAQLRGKSKLIICPDRALWDVPFAVLPDKTGTPLLERFSLSYANSANTWHAAQTSPRKPSASTKLLVVANPQFDAEKRFESGPHVPGQRPITVPDRPITVPNRPLTVPDRPLTVPDRPLTVPDRDLYVPRGTRLVDLPGTQREADALAKRFPSATVYTRTKAQESVVKQEASKFQRLHLASHAFVNDAAPLLSSVVLANPAPGSGDDGFLTAREIFELDLSGVELVVLSACNTARGAKQGSEGVMGLTWALFAAGCPTQVLSQWAVDDSSTATLMTHFYDGLARGKGKSAALRQAALMVRKNARYTHPYFWAPFVLIGDPR